MCTHGWRDRGERHGSVADACDVGGSHGTRALHRSRSTRQGFRGHARAGRRCRIQGSRDDELRRRLSPAQVRAALDKAGLRRRVRTSLSLPARSSSVNSPDTSRSATSIPRLVVPVVRAARLPVDELEAHPLVPLPAVLLRAADVAGRRNRHRPSTPSSVRRRPTTRLAPPESRMASRC